MNLILTYAPQGPGISALGRPDCLWCWEMVLRHDLGAQVLGKLLNAL
jgi:hypothetical protein